LVLASSVSLTTLSLSIEISLARPSLLDGLVFGTMRLPFRIFLVAFPPSAFVLRPPHLEYSLFISLLDFWPVVPLSSFLFRDSLFFLDVFFPFLLVPVFWLLAFSCCFGAKRWILFLSPQIPLLFFFFCLLGKGASMKLASLSPFFSSLKNAAPLRSPRPEALGLSTFSLFVFSFWAASLSLRTRGPHNRFSIGHVSVLAEDSFFRFFLTSPLRVQFFSSFWRS